MRALHSPSIANLALLSFLSSCVSVRDEALENHLRGTDAMRKVLTVAAEREKQPHLLAVVPHWLGVDRNTRLLLNCLNAADRSELIGIALAS